MQDIKKSIAVRGDSVRIFDAAAGVLMPHGFRVVRRTPKDMELEGPPFVYQQRSPYWGASRCLFHADGQRLDLEVHMNRMRDSNRLGAQIGFGLIFVLGSMTTIFAITHPDVMWPILLVTFLPAGFVALLIAGIAVPQLERRTDAAYDTLLQNAAMMGEPHT